MKTLVEVKIRLATLVIHINEAYERKATLQIFSPEWIACDRHRCEMMNEYYDIAKKYPDYLKDAKIL